MLHVFACPGQRFVLFCGRRREWVARLALQLAFQPLMMRACRKVLSSECCVHTTRETYVGLSWRRMART